MSPLDFFELAKANGVAGLVVALIVFLSVYLLRFTDLLKTGRMRRVGTVVLALLLSGVKVGDTESALTALIALVVSTLFNTLVEYLTKKPKG